MFIGMSGSKSPKRIDLVYPELSYKIVGCLYEVWNVLGPGHSELTYQKATATMFRKENIRYVEQLSTPVYFHNQLINNRFIDFVVEESIVVELKKSNRFSIQHIRQLSDYLIRTKLKLGILANFTWNGVVTKRIININNL